MKKYEVVIKQIQIQTVELPENEEFDIDVFWDKLYDLGDCELNSEIVKVKAIKDL